MTRSFYWYQNICPCDLGHQWNWPLSGAFVFHKHILFNYLYHLVPFHQTFYSVYPSIQFENNHFLETGQQGVWMLWRWKMIKSLNVSSRVSIFFFQEFIVRQFLFCFNFDVYHYTYTHRAPVWSVRFEWHFETLKTWKIPLTISVKRIVKINESKHLFSLISKYV